MELSKRRQYFEQIKKTVKESQDYLLIGVDVAKAKHDACFMLSSGKVLNKHFKFNNTQEGFESFFEKIKRYQVAALPKVTIVGIETTGNYMVPLCHYLEENNVSVVQVSSFVTKRNRDTLTLSWNKNDVKDAWNITDCMRQGKIMFYAYPNDCYGDMKRMMNIFSRLSTERGKYKVRLQNNVLCLTFPEFGQVFTEVSELVPMTILERYPLPQDINQLSEQEFVDDIVKNTDPTVKKIKIARVYKLAQQSIGSSHDSESLRWETRFIIQRIQEICKTQKEMLLKVQSLAEKFPEYDLLQTIPGVGPILSAIIMTTIGDIDNYRSSKQILKLAGLDLAQIQSGQFRGDVRISRRGKPALRCAAYQAALVASRYDNNLRLKYLNLIQRKDIQKGQKRKIIIAIACKILRIAYSVMKYKKPYEDEYHVIKSDKDELLMFSDTMQTVVDETSRVLMH